MKKFKLFPLAISLSSIAMAEMPTVEKATLPIQQTAQQNPQIQQEKILPQLSFETQQARAAALVKDVNYTLEQEKIHQEQERKLAEAETRVKQEIGNNTLLLSSATAKVYLDNDFAPMWSDATATRTFLKEYALFAVSSVSNKAAGILQQILAQPDGFLARDILLTDAFLDYLYYNKNVARNANNWLYNLGSYRTSTPSVENISSWVNAVKNGNAVQFMNNLVPRNHLYQETTERLLAMSPNGVTASGEKKVSKGKSAKSGEKTPVSDATTFYKLALNAQRLRIIPSFNNGIFVNIPSYQLYYFIDGKPVLQSKVIVGREDRRTPVMYSKLSNVVVNPPWNVPPTILSKDIIPALAKNPGIADARNYEILDGSGNKVNPYSVNWSKYLNTTNIPYRIRQKAGDDSALGRYKFNMPSSDAIYLHDTPNRGLFGKTERALSSGCVRVAKADELATVLLREAGWSADKQQKVLDSNKTTSARINSENPVYLYYVTAWVEGGKVFTLPDIYKLDQNQPKPNLNWQTVKNVI
mgnify:FL=1